MNRKENVTFVAGDAEAGTRLDVAMAVRLALSRAVCSRLIKQGAVKVDGATAKPSHQLAPGERVEVEMPPAAQPEARPETVPISLVYDDEDLCVVDKPAGMATHPAPGSMRGTLVNALLGALGPLPAVNTALRPGIVHRLDRDTSGLLVVAKSERAMRALAKAIAARRIKRYYHAVVWGIPANPRGAIDAPLARDRARRTMFAVSRSGRRAVTHYRVVEQLGACALLEIELETGRTHQIRVHCAAIGHPVVGDRVYGAGRPDLGMPRQALHAAKLEFEHPVTGRALSFTSPWPADFAALVARLRT